MEIGTEAVPRTEAEAPLAVRAVCPLAEGVMVMPAFLQKDELTTVRAAPVSQIKRPRMPFERKVMLESCHDVTTLDATRSPSSTTRMAVEGRSVQDCVGSAERM